MKLFNKISLVITLLIFSPTLQAAQSLPSCPVDAHRQPISLWRKTADNSAYVWNGIRAKTYNAWCILCALTHVADVQASLKTIQENRATHNEQTEKKIAELTQKINALEDKSELFKKATESAISKSMIKHEAWQRSTYKMLGQFLTMLTEHKQMLATHEKQYEKIDCQLAAQRDLIKTIKTEVDTHAEKNSQQLSSLEGLLDRSEQISKLEETLSRQNTLREEQYKTIKEATDACKREIEAESTDRKNTDNDQKEILVGMNKLEKEMQEIHRSLLSLTVSTARELNEIETKSETLSETPRKLDLEILAIVANELDELEKIVIQPKQNRQAALQQRPKTLERFKNQLFKDTKNEETKESTK